MYMCMRYTHFHTDKKNNKLHIHTHAHTHTHTHTHTICEWISHWVNLWGEKNTFQSVFNRQAHQKVCPSALPSVFLELSLFFLLSPLLIAFRPIMGLIYPAFEPVSSLRCRYRSCAVHIVPLSAFAMTCWWRFFLFSLFIWASGTLFLFLFCFLSVRLLFEPPALVLWGSE